MKVIVNKFIPFHGFVAMAFYGIVLWREEYEYIKYTYRYSRVINHESIHEALMKDFCKWLPVGGTIFYIVYLLEWLFRLLFTKDFMSINAYKNLSFELEAKQNLNNLKYLETRKKFAQYKL